MWRRALLAAAAVSYLICVLIMSGMQKEDMDASMLRKLQRYNVNLDDINNERIRQQCSSRTNDLTTGDQNNHKEGYVSTTEYKSTVTTKDPLPPVTLDMDNVLNYLKSRENTVTYSDEKTAEKTTPTEETVTVPAENIKNQPKVDLDLLRRYIQLETQNKSFYKQDGNSKTNENYTSIKLKTNEKYLNDVEFINKQIKDYLSKQQNIPTTTTTEYTIPRYTIDIQSIYKQIDEIIANGSNKDNGDTVVKKYLDKDGQSNVKTVNRPLNIMPIGQNISYSTEKRLFESFYNFLSNMNQFKNNTFQPFPIYDNVYSGKVQIQNNQNNHENYKENTTQKLKSEMVLNQQVLTSNIVKEIADTLKKDIIKDIRNELASIYLKTTQTTTQVTPTTTTRTTEISSTTTSNSKTQDLAIIDKFMELYDQIKSLKQPSFLLKANNDSTTFVNNLNQPIKAPIKNEMFMPLLNRLQIPETKVPIPSVVNYNTNPFINYNSYLPRKEKHRSPITIQTNSVEIQPLAIPISQHESLIRQNIIVHPGYRYQGRIDQHRNFSPRGNRYSDSDVPIMRANRTYNYSPLKHYDRNSVRYPPYRFQEPKQREDIIRFRLRDNGNSRLDTDYYEKINFGNEHDNVKDKQGIFDNRNIARFHERLERVDTGSDGTPVVSDVDVTGKQEQNGDFPSRHQLSLVDMKKGSSYDDTHFKNFLKTQQKVTDVLERILAARPKTNTPRSVEAV